LRLEIGTEWLVDRVIERQSQWQCRLELLGTHLVYGKPEPLEGREQNSGGVGGGSSGVSPLELPPTAIQLLDGVFPIIATHGAELIENAGFGCTCCAAVPQANGLEVGLPFISTYITVSSR
jgi:hypothetical protein